MATVSAFPINVYAETLIEVPIAFNAERYEFEDGSMEVNVQPCGIARWELRYTGLSAEDLHTLETHYIEAKGRVNDFQFSNRRNGFTYFNVKYVSFEIPARAKRWNNDATIVLEGLI